MNNLPRFTWRTLLCLLSVLGCAAGTRVWYVATCADNGKQSPALLVQGQCSPDLAGNLVEYQWFGGMTPLSEKEERTAHIAPGYPMLYASVAYWSDNPDVLMRWLQCALGTLTAGCYFFFARRAFHSTFIATVAGLFCAGHPFWILNTAELHDGVLISFLLSASLALGTRGSQTGGAFTGLCFGLTLSGIAMTRAALLPFSIVALLWFLWQCRRLSLGWFVAFLALIGFINGLATWSIRNYQVFERPVPVATSTYLHLWMGNNLAATGSEMDKPALEATLSKDRLKELVDESNQAKRYNHLADEFWQESHDHPKETLARRINAALVFLFGECWLKQGSFAAITPKGDGIAETPEWLRDHAETILHATMLAMFALALLGWRLSHVWRRQGRMATIAALCVPMPYIISHAEYLSGPRLPLDGVLLCYAAYALVSLIPGLSRSPEPATKPKKKPAPS